MFSETELLLSKRARKFFLKIVVTALWFLSLIQENMDSKNGVLAVYIWKVSAYTFFLIH